MPSMYAYAWKVETKRQRDIVKKMGIRMIQGYYYGKPMTIEEFENKYLI